MDWLPIVRFVHLVAAATWTGGLIVLAALVFALRKAGAERSYLVAAARMFGKVSWTAMLVAIPTGLWQVELRGIPWAHGPLHVKITVVAVAVVLALVHQLTAKRAKPAVRGIMELGLLLAGLGIFAAAVALGA